MVTISKEKCLLLIITNRFNHEMMLSREASSVKTIFNEHKIRGGELVEPKIRNRGNKCEMHEA